MGPYTVAAFDVQVRCFALEKDYQFVYLALERCQCALADAVEPQAGSAQLAAPLHLLQPDGGGPSSAAWAVAKDIGEGLLFLHERGFVHRDLKVCHVASALYAAFHCQGRHVSCAFAAAQRAAEHQRPCQSVGHGPMYTAAQ